eukprot:SRR837773.11022.p1 GENE.SRR837773.11022~~SRR837773.11022.p1  ORF type:complete len:196 (+),score=69.07 SRR837773.11022:63-590(+)
MDFMDNPSMAMPPAGVSDPNLLAAGGADAFAEMAPPADPFVGMPASGEAWGGAPAAAVDASALRKWEAEHQQQLEEASRKETIAKNERKAKAAEELKAYHESMKENNTKRFSTNRQAQASAEAAKNDSTKGMNPWEVVASLIDTKGDAAKDNPLRDTSRMRALLIQLKSTPIGTL